MTGEDIYYLNKNESISYTLNKFNKQFNFITNGIIRETITKEAFSKKYDFTNAWIGRDCRTGDTCLQGTIYTIRIYNRELSNEEIQHNYNIDKYRFDITE